MSIECHRCSSHNAEGSHFCDQCGSPLGVGEPGKTKKSLSRLWVLLTVCALGWFLHDQIDLERGERGRDRDGGASESGTSNDALGDRTSEVLEDPPAELFAQETSQGSGKLVAGWLQFEDPHGVVLERIPTAVTRGGWLAVPRLVALGANRWVFRPGLGGETEVIDGVWARGEPVGLWRVDSPDLSVAPLLETWIESEPLIFVGYSGNRRETFSPQSRVRKAGLFFKAEPPLDLGRGGLLLQEEAIVGWATGESEPALWLWAGDPGDLLVAERTVGEFYVDSFAGGREELISEAHALAESSSSPRVRVVRKYVDALRLQPRLREEESRDRWRSPSAVPPLVRSLRALLDAGAPQSITETLDLSVVRTLNHGGVFLLWIDAVGEVEGAEVAISLIDRWGSTFVPVGSELEEQLISRLLSFFRDAVRTAIDAETLTRAWSWVEDARSRFPDDPDLYLSEVELWLEEGDWRRAEELLDAVRFPAKFRDRVGMLEARVSALKGIEGRIVIRFRPGASTIPATANLSGIEQQFIVDTGASYTSIPWRTVNALGLRIDQNTPRRQLRTASDLISVPVVVLPEIELGGWTVSDVEVTVLDLPGNDALGLLGLNFLGEFRVDLDRDQGILTLDPK